MAAEVAVVGALVVGVLYATGNSQVVNDGYAAGVTLANDFAASVASVWDSIFATKSEEAWLRWKARELDLEERALSEALHRIKEGSGLGGRPVEIDGDGNVTDPRSGDPIGNVIDECE